MALECFTDLKTLDVCSLLELLTVANYFADILNGLSVITIV